MKKITRRDAIRLSAVGALPLGALASGAGEGAGGAPGDAVYDIAFEGGGAKGCAFAGALEVLMEEGSGRRLGRLIGASAGAITATFLAAGYSAGELNAMLKEPARGATEPGPLPPDAKDRPTRRMAQLMDWATRDSVQSLIAGSDTLKAFQEAAVQARRLMADNARAAAEKEDEKRKAPEPNAKGSRAKAIALRSFAAALHSKVADEFFDPIIALSMLTALLRNKRVAPAFASVEAGGFLIGREILSWLGEKLGAKGIEPTDTLRTLYEKKGKASGRELSIIASDTTDLEMLVLNHRTAPDCPVIQAVRMSMSIPFVFPEVEWQEAWGAYLGRPKRGNVIVDGGMLSNFPIALLQRPPALPEVLIKDLRDAPDRAASRLEMARRIMGESLADAGPVSVLGLLIDESRPVKGAPEPPARPELFKQSIDRANRLINTVTGTWDSAAVQQFKDRICRLPAKGYGVLEFGMDDPRLEPLLKAAGEAMREFLTKA